jgi:uncharacterized protein YkwD
MKAEIVRLTNEERKKAGLNPVEVLPELMDCAQLKAQDMFDNDYFDHKSKKYGTPDKMIKKLVSNVSYGTENLAHISTKYPGVFVESWMNSKTHKENILTARHLYIGIGIVPIGRLSAGYSTEFIVVQQFAG